MEAKRLVLTASLEKQNSGFDSCRFTQKIQGLTLQRFSSYEGSRGGRFRVIFADFLLTSDGCGGQTAGFNSFFRKAKFTQITSSTGTQSSKARHTSTLSPNTTI